MSKLIIAPNLTVVALLVLALSEHAPAGETTPERVSKSGYAEVPEFGGPRSVGATLKEADEILESLLRFPSIDDSLQPWFDFKGRTRERYGLSFGGDYTVLYQGATESLGKDSAAGGIFRFFGNWTLLGRDSGNTGSLVFNVENQHRLGTDIAPEDLGFEIGYVGLTSETFNDSGWGLTNLHWQQKLSERRVTVVAGIVDTGDYVDVYALNDPWTQFSNFVFGANPTVAAPGPGFGGGAGVMATDNIYVVVGLADANGDPTDPGGGFDTFFSDHEYFTHLEIGLVSSYERRYLDNIHLTLWHVDEREEAQAPDDWGLAFSATKFINDQWMPFLRAGYADGEAALLEGMVSAGIGRYFAEHGDVLGIGVSWGKPSGDGLADQYTAEAFYRLQLAQYVAITPDAQVIVDPALNPDEDVIGVFGLRARLTF
jgi:porin